MSAHVSIHSQPHTLPVGIFKGRCWHKNSIFPRTRYIHPCAHKQALSQRHTSCHNRLSQLHLHTITTAIIIIAKPGWVIALYFSKGFRVHYFILSQRICFSFILGKSFNNEFAQVFLSGNVLIASSFFLLVWVSLIYSTWSLSGFFNVSVNVFHQIWGIFSCYFFKYYFCPYPFCFWGILLYTDG